LPRHRRLLLANHHRDEQVLLVRVDAHVRSSLFSRPAPVVAALAPSGATFEIIGAPGMTRTGDPRLRRQWV
jgi:hypothetical protein